MKLVLLLISVASALVDSQRCGERPASRSRIAGGKEVTSSAEWPWVVRLTLTVRQGQGAAIQTGCTGSLIAEQWILTAAHCLGTDVQQVRIRMGQRLAENTAFGPEFTETLNLTDANQRRRVRFVRPRSLAMCDFTLTFDPRQ